MITIDRLIQEKTADEIFELALDSLEAVGIPANSWREGGVARSIVAIFSQFGAQGSSVLASCVKGMFLLFAEGVYLTAHAKDVYDVDRIEATFATGYVTLTNTGGAVHTVGADECVVRSSNTGARYRITEAFVLSSGSEASPTVSDPLAVSAIEPGAGSSVAPAELDELETTLARVTVFNESAIVGRDAETDAQLVVRCLAKKGTWSPFGPRDSYEYAALSALLEDGSPVSVTRVAVSRYSSTGQVTIVCATPSGAPSEVELEAVRASVEAKARTDTATATVSAAITKDTALTIILWARGGSEAVLLAAAEDAFAELIAEYPIGGYSKTDGGQGYLYLDRVAAAVIGSSPEAFDVDFGDDDEDIALDEDEVATYTTTTTFEVRIK